jgi:Spy/CpxP family protein refolding chaperone
MMNTQDNMRERRKEMTVMKKAAIFAVAALMLLSTAVFAQSGPGHPGTGRMGDCDFHGGRGMGMRMGGGTPGVQMLLAHADDLNLTQDQKQKLQSMVVEFQTQRVDKQAVLEKAQINLRSLMMNDASANEVNAAIDKVYGARADMQKMQYAHRQQVKSVLTEDQLTKLKEMWKDRPFRKGFGDRNCTGDQTRARQHMGTGSGQ